MANRIVRTKLQAGPRFIIYHLYIQSDGASGEVTDYVLVDPTQEEMGGHKRFSLSTAMWAFDGFSGSLFFQDLVDGTLEWVLPAAGGNESADFDVFGGLLDRSDSDGSGKLLFSTVGFQGTGNAGSLIVKVKLH